jgi:hypothetical protein
MRWATPAASIPANAVGRVATSQTTTSSSYTDLATAGPAVTVTTGTKALVIVTANMNCNSINDRPHMSFEVSGATTIAVSDTNAAIANVYINSSTRGFRFSAATVVTLTAGSNTFTSKYKGDAGGATFTFLDREIFVVNLA